MAKTKMKLAASVVALMVAAVALIGVAYAAYTATLADSETKNMTNSYVTLGIGVNNLEATVNLDWDSSTITSAGEGTTTWTLKNQSVHIGGFVINKTVEGSGASDDYTLTAPTATVTLSASPVSGFSFEIYDNSGYTGDALDDLTGMEYGHTYYLLLKYEGGVSPLAVTSAPGTLSLTYSINASAN